MTYAAPAPTEPYLVLTPAGVLRAYAQREPDATCLQLQSLMDGAVAPRRSAWLAAGEDRDALLAEAMAAGWVQEATRRLIAPDVQLDDYLPRAIAGLSGTRTAAIANYKGVGKVDATGGEILLHQPEVGLAAAAAVGGEVGADQHLFPLHPLRFKQVHHQVVGWLEVLQRQAGGAQPILVGDHHQHVTGGLQRGDQLQLVFRAGAREHVGLLRSAAQGRVVHRGNGVAGQRAVGVQAQLAADGCRRHRMVAGDHLHPDAGLLALGHRGHRFVARRVDDAHQAQHLEAWAHVGQVHLAAFAGLGLGTHLLQTGEDTMQECLSSDFVLEAEVLPDNVMSRRLFTSAGYDGGPRRFHKTVLAQPRCSSSSA